MKSEVNIIEEEIFTLSFVLANSAGNIYWKDRKGYYIGCNREFAEIAGLNSPREIIGLTDKDLFIKKLGEEGVEKLLTIDKLVVEFNKEITSEEIGINKEGEAAYYLSKKMPLKNKLGKIVGIIGTSVDITQQKQADELKSEFMKNMMHDIRTPFCGIYGMTELLWRQEQDVKKKEYLECILESAKKLLDYNNEILDFHKYTIDDFNKEQNVCFDYRNIVDEVIKMNMPAAKIKNIELTAKFPNKDELLTGDANSLKKILINLVGNAVKFTQSGYIYIIIQLLHQDNRFLMELIVQDSGIGISKNKHEIIFDKFVRLNSSYEGIYLGNGLGLSIVKNIIKKMQGTIEVESESGKGARFICRLPFNQQKKCIA